jgi:hypothetical protein
VVGAPNGVAGTLFDPDWHYQFPNYLVNHWFGSFRGNHLIADQEPALNAHQAQFSPVTIEEVW